MNNNLFRVMFLLLFTTLCTPAFAAIPIKVPNEMTVVTPALKKKDKKPTNKKDKSRKANNAFVMGLFALVLVPPLGIVAIIYGALSITYHEPNQARAIWGLVLGGLATLYTLALTGLLISGVM